MDVKNLLGSAAAAHAAGRLPEAASLCRQVIGADPGNIQAALLLGIVCAKSGELVEAEKLLEQVQKADPASFQAPFWLSVVCRRLGQTGRAIQAAEAAVRANSNDPQGWAQLGICYLDARYLTESESSFRTATQLAPGAIQIQASLCHCLFLQGRNKEARDALESALDRANLGAEALLKIGESLLSQEYAAVSAGFARRAIHLAPESARAHLLAGRALMDGVTMSEAVTHLQSAVRLEPSNAEAIAILGTGLQGLGRIEEASEMFRRSLALEPNQGYAYFALFQNRRVTEEDQPEISRMEQLAADTKLPGRQRSYLHYGLAKAYENLGRYEESMSHYDQANPLEAELSLQGRPFDRNELATRTDRTRRSFTKASLAPRSQAGSDSEIPIFVVGMMRSGTTLVEQILSAHPDIGAAGEQHFWPDNWRQAMDSTQNNVDDDGLRVLSERYLGLIREIAPGKERVVDKMPENRLGLGILHLAFPHARIIHTRRNPVDTCLSIYMTPNRVHVEYAHDRRSIVEAYKEYLRLMQHWRAVLPREIFLEVDYEDLVNDLEGVTRRMIEFCGLDWRDECLKPENNPRSVATPSSWQVRQPIYKTSAERWRRFEPWLGPFTDLL